MRTTLTACLLWLCACPDLDGAYERCVDRGRCSDATAFTVEPTAPSLISAPFTEAHQVLTFTNVSGVAVSAPQLGLRGNAGAFRLSEDGCVQRALQPNERCTVKLHYRAFEPEVRSALLDIVAQPAGARAIAIRGETRPGARLTVEVEGAERGDVEVPGFGRCAERCAFDLPTGLSINLAAHGNPRARFLSWANACGGSDARCPLTLEGAATARAIFEPRPSQVELKFVGGNTGTATFSPVGEPCGALCRRYPGPQQVVVRVAPPRGALVSGFAGCAPLEGELGCTVEALDLVTMTATLGRPAYAFVTSQTVVPGALGSVAAGDAFCNAVAADAGLGGNYLAWLSSGTVPAWERLSGAWIRLDDEPVAADERALARGELLAPILLDERGRMSGHPLVATGTEYGSSPLVLNCMNWSSLSAPLGFWVGGSAFSDALWTEGTLPGVAGLSPGCDAGYPLYCFGTGSSGRLAPPALPATAKRAFVTRDAFDGNLGGLSGADQRCQADASDAGLGGTWFAALGATGTPWSTRFGAFDGGHFRLDGTRLTFESSLPAGGFRAALNHDALGRVVHDAQAWTGADQYGVVSTPTCSGWTSNFDAGVGRSSATGSALPLKEGTVLLGGGLTSEFCDRKARLFCFER